MALLFVSGHRYAPVANHLRCPVPTPLQRGRPFGSENGAVPEAATHYFGTHPKKDFSRLIPSWYGEYLL